MITDEREFYRKFLKVFFQYLTLMGAQRRIEGFDYLKWFFRNPAFEDILLDEIRKGDIWTKDNIKEKRDEFGRRMLEGMRSKWKK